MASLTGKFIKDTYQSLLKMIDNENVSSTAKEITDGEGNGTGVSIDTSGNLTAIGTIQGSSVTNGTTSITDLQNNKENKSEKGEADGYAPLDSNSKVPTENLPDSVLGQLEYIGTWNADTNTPTLPSADAVKGNYYVVSVAGVYETIDYEIGDWIVSNGVEWEKVDNSDKVSSVNGQKGVVVLDTDDINEGNTNQYYTSDRANSDFDIRLATKDTDDLTEGSNLYYTEARVSANPNVSANTAKVGITEAQSDAIIANTAKNSYPAEDAAKLLGIESGANVTDVANVTTALNSISIKKLSDVSETDPSNEQVLRYNSTSGEYEPTTLNLTGAVDSVNGQTGAVSLGLLDLDDVGTDGTSGQVLTTDGLGSFSFTTVSGGGGAVDSVNGQTGTVVLDADDISDTDTTNKFTSASDITKLSGIESGAEVNPTSTDELTEGTTNLYYTEARTDARVDAQTGANLDLSQRTTSDLNEGTNLYYTEARVSANTDVAANTAKVGITAQQATDITTNNAKVGITTEQADAITANTLKNSYPSADATKVGYISVTQAVDLDALESDVTTNNAKVGITTQQADEIAANTLKTGITTEQASAITANTEKVGITTQQASDITANNAKVSMVLGTTAGTALEGNTPLLQLGTTSTTALAGDTTTITAQQAADIVTNNAKVGITAQQAADITANNAKISFDSASSTKLAGIEENAEVNVNADWNATEGDAQILNKPTLATVATTGEYSDLSGTPSLATVATSGSYTDLSNTPTIPTNNNELTNGAGYITDGNTGWDNTYGFITASSTATLTNKSGSNNQWTNDAGYINEAAQTLHTNAIGNAIDFSARVTLAGGVAEGTSGIIKNLQSIL